MNPRKVKELIPISDLPLELVQDLISFYWSFLHKDLTSLDYYHVNVPYVGTFHIKGDKYIKKEIERVSAFISKTPPKTMYKYAKYMENQTRISKLNKLLDYHNQQVQKKKDIKQLRKNVREARESLGEPQANS